jgi:hypothetical protein
MSSFISSIIIEENVQAKRRFPHENTSHHYPFEERRVSSCRGWGGEESDRFSIMVELERFCESSQPTLEDNRGMAQPATHQDLRHSGCVGNFVALDPDGKEGGDRREYDHHGHQTAHLVKHT